VASFLERFGILRSRMSFEPRRSGLNPGSWSNGQDRRAEALVILASKFVGAMPMVAVQVALGDEVLQLTTDPAVPSSHVLHGGADLHAGFKAKWCCTLGACAWQQPRGCNTTWKRMRSLPLTEELGTTGPSVSPDGRYLYCL